MRCRWFNNHLAPSLAEVPASSFFRKYVSNTIHIPYGIVDVYFAYPRRSADEYFGYFGNSFLIDSLDGLLDVLVKENLLSSNATQLVISSVS